MQRRTLFIFITVFILVGALMVGFYYYFNRTKATTDGTSTTTGYQSFNPFSNPSPDTSDGTATTTGGDTAATTPTNDDTDTTPSISKFHQITDFSVAGAAYFDDTRPLPEAQAVTTTPAAPVTAPAPTTKTTKAKVVAPPAPQVEIVPSIRYVERVTGHIDQMYLDTKTTGKVSNSTIPGIYEAVFDGKAQTVIYRYLDSGTNDITSFMATLGGTKGEFLPENILDVSVSVDKSKFFYMTKTSSGVVGTVRAYGETKATQVFSSSYSEWLSQWVGAQKIYLTTKASAQVDGQLYALNTATGTLAKVFGGVPGLTTLANGDGSLVLYSSSTGGGPKLGLLDVAKHTTSGVNAYGLPEKCVWSNDKTTIFCAIPDDISGSQYPDSWYQGKVSFDDHFVQINTTTGDTTTIADSQDGTLVDATHLFLDKAENQIFFINKKDSTLWSLDIR